MTKRQDSQTTASKSRASRVLPYKTKNLKDDYFLGRVLGQGQFGTTFLCSHNENSLVVPHSLVEQGTTFSKVVGSAYYDAPEVLRNHYGRDCDRYV
ncbi:hypothetical protein Bca52824_049971 [Brassica carinata]|uniref:Protein kinase domain-containing protein n=1 Tax=Brassica carinata TaxID=52824 RepID=A0A8X7RLW5_BRACI|nr:hypothetical protein Bca52824_049971 [Brassica carinata]